MNWDEPDGATPLDPDEIEGLKLLHIQTRGELNEVEQANIQQGEQWLGRQRTYSDVLTDDFLRALHAQLFGEVWEWAGSYRRTEKNVGIDPIYISIELRNLLDDARYWVEHNTYSREEFAAHFHHRLVQIHPFPNGNGRHGRVMTDLVLEKLLKVQPINWRSDALIGEGEHRSNYINALRAADGLDYQPLVEFVSQ